MELNRQSRSADPAPRGIIRFRGYDSHTEDSPFIRVKHNHDMKEVWQMMTDDDHWRLPLPKLLISVTGEAKTLTPHPRVKAILKQGLVNAAANTGAWIITGGRATGMMKMVGEAVSEYADATGNQTGQELVVLGIVSLGCVANRHLFKEKALQKNGRKPLTYIMPGEMSDSHCAPLDHNHTHFLLVDDGTERQPGGEIDFRSDLEKYISTQKKDSQDVKIPTVLVVVEGGVNTLKTVRKSLKRGSPVVVISGSGRAADLLSEAKKLDMRRDGSRTGITLTTTKDILDVSDEMACRALGDINECLREDRKNNLVNIFNPAAADSGTNFEREILCALLKAQNLKVNQQVSLAMAWQHCDIAKQCIFSSENRCNWQEADLSSSMLDALVEDQADFVQLFLDLGLDLERFLCVETLWQLYSKCLAKSAVAKELLTYSSSRITSTATTTQYEVGLDLKDNPHLLFDISKVIVHLLKDNSFNFYSDFHVLGEGFQYPSFKHPERELFLWSILFNRRDLAQIVWKDGLDHIGGALCARALLKEMSVIAEEMEMAEFSEDLAKHSVEWEAHALTVLAECYSRDHLLTHNLLVRELRHWAPEESALLCTSDTAGHPAHTNTPDTAGRPTPLSMTESYEMTDFAGHSACQTKLTDIWNGGLAGNTSIWKICLCIFLPFLIFSIKFTDDSRPRNKDDQSFKGRKNSIFPQDPGCSPKKVETCQEEEDAGRRDQDLNLRLKSVSLCATGPDSIDFGQALYYFYTAPVTKFVFNIISYLCFLALFSYVMLVKLNKTSPRAEEYVIWGWTLTMVAEGFRRMSVSR
ncbi:hypothetical protein V1264_009572 [Littorina saxatilis]|uniref:TRPM SLOG domain-containing protein n=1 Tax=Littorina saxatilis TaxID=31220 RepID=A0AAN9AS11_9CAEN